MRPRGAKTKGLGGREAPGSGGRYNVLRGESNVDIVPAIRGYAAEDILVYLA